MTFRSSVLYAFRLLFSKSKSGESSHGGRSLFGAMLCIGISLIPLVGVQVVSQGMIDGITGRMIGLSTQDLQVRVNAYSTQIDSAEKMYDIAGRIANVRSVLEVYPEVQGMGLMVANGIRCGASIRAVPQDIFVKNKNFSTLFKIKEGQADLASERGAVFGEKIASDLGIHPGDKVSFVTINKIGETTVPKMSQFTVTGIVSSGYQELDALWVFIPLETGYQVLSQKSCQFMFGVVTPDSFSPSLMTIKSRIVRELSGNGDTDLEPLEHFRVYSWNELNAAEYENFASTKILLLLIMLLIVLVASVNISSALVMIVMERRKEIAILKSVGGTAGGITVSFLIVGIGAGTGGVLIGIPLGLLGAVNINGLIKIVEWLVNICAKFVYLIVNRDLSGFNVIHLLDPAYYLQDIPISISFSDLMIITLGTLLLSLLVSAIPAIKAGKEKPLDTLRKM